MHDLLLEPRHRRGSRPRPSVALLLIVAIAAAVVLAAEVAPGSPRFVRTITISNPSAFQVQTDVARPNDNGWVPIGAVEPGRTQAFGEVFDVGDAWVFRFSYGGVVAEERTESRRDLASARWHVRISSDAAARLDAAGLAPSAGVR